MIDLGPIEPLLEDPDVYEIMVNGPKNIHVWRRNAGREKVDAAFRDFDHLRLTIDAILETAGTELSPERPLVNTWLLDGTRVQAIIPPASMLGPVLHLSRPMVQNMTIENLIEFGSITSKAAEFLAACVRARRNIIIGGDYNSGKTTMLYVLGNFVPDSARIVVLQEVGDRSLKQPDVILLQTRPPDLQGQNAITMRMLLDMTLNLSPDSILIGEVRGDEAADLLGVMSRGYHVLSAIHAANIRDILGRLERMASAASPGTPLLLFREQMAAGIHLLVEQHLMEDGRRHITRITEMCGLQGDMLELADIFDYEEARGLYATGIVPHFLDKLEGIEESFFDASE